MPVTFTSLAATTMKNYMSTLANNVMFSSALFARLKEKNRVTIDGGTEVVYPIKKSLNSTTMSYQGYDKLDITTQDNFDKLEYKLCNYNVSVVYSDEEIDQNSGKSRAINLINSKIENAQTDLINCINWDLNGHTSINPLSTNPMHSLAYFASDTPAVGTVGDTAPLSRVTNTFLRNKQAAATGAWGSTTNRRGRIDFNSMFTQLRRSRMNGEKPDLALGGITALNLLQQEAIATERDSDSDFKEIKGYGSVDMRLNGCDIVMDELIDADVTDPLAPSPNTSSLHFYILTTKYMELLISKNYNFKTIPAIRPTDQAAFVQHIRVRLQLCCNNLSRMGVITGITG